VRNCFGDPCRGASCAVAKALASSAKRSGAGSAATDAGCGAGPAIADASGGSNDGAPEDDSGSAAGTSSGTGTSSCDNGDGVAASFAGARGPRFNNRESKGPTPLLERTNERSEPHAYRMPGSLPKIQPIIHPAKAKRRIMAKIAVLVRVPNRSFMGNNDTQNCQTSHK
jgi:hypothetical protein